MKTVAILGCGPSGLLAAHAVGLAGRPLSLHSKPQKSRLGGAQYLHSSVPYLTDTAPEFTITNRLYGTPAQYKQKIYGLDPMTVPLHVSAEGVTDGEQFGAWSLGSAYETLWTANQHAINEAKIDGEWMEAHANEFELIISSIPRHALCIDPNHQFKTQTIWIKPGAPSFIPEGEVHYNGERSPAWYRASNINGAGGVEWSTRGAKPPLDGLIEVVKPLTTNCDCWPKVFYVGRYGEWRKGVLAHDAFWNTIGLMKDLYLK